MQKTKGITNTPVFGIHKRTEQKQMLLSCAVMIFFHPDYTVGFGISPNQRICARGLYRRWGITPRPEEFSFI